VHEAYTIHFFERGEFHIQIVNGIKNRKT